MCLIPLAIAAATVAADPAPPQTRVTPVLVEAVAVAESNNDDCAIGDGGRARTAWQIWPSAWETANEWRRQHNQVTFPRSWAKDQRVARAIATSLLEWHEYQLRKAGVPSPTHEQIYMSYAMGLESFRSIGFIVDNAPAHKLRAVERLRKSISLQTKPKPKPNNDNGGIPRLR